MHIKSTGYYSAFCFVFTTSFVAMTIAIRRTSFFAKCMYVCVYVCMDVWMYVYTYVCMYVYTYV
jgi:hypothetical protein